MLARFTAPLLLITPALAQATFTPLGAGMRASGISSDGQWVTGYAAAGTFRWSSGSGLNFPVTLGSQGGNVQCSTGCTFGCNTYTNPSTNNQEAARWDASGNVQYLGGLASQSGTSLSTAYGMDDSGTVIVGLGWVTAGTAHAFKWTLAGGMTDLGASPGGFSSRANGVSPDGSVTVGWDNGSPRKPVYWSGGTMTPIGNGTLSGEGWAASTNGAVITGVYNGQLLRWTQATGAQQLGKLPGSVSSDQASGLDISADGGTIVGINGSVLGTGFRALLWRSDLGLVELQTYLNPYLGAQLSGWSLQAATGISADGRTICGYGFDPGAQLEAWVITLPPDSPLSPYCTPGTAGVITCPCSNPPAGANRGCDNSAATGGASISATGLALLSNDTVVVSTANQRPTGTTILLQGVAQTTGAIFGQGVRCVNGTLKRLYVKSASGGSISVPGAGDPTISARSSALGDPIGSNSTREYTAYYRDPTVLGGCPAASTWNCTNAGQIFWYP